jgi:hypothetical protein
MAKNPIDDQLTPDEQRRILDCVEACDGIGNPRAIVCLLAALHELGEAWTQGRLISGNDAEAEMVMDAVAKLELQLPPDQSQN